MFGISRELSREYLDHVLLLIERDGTSRQRLVEAVHDTTTFKYILRYRAKMRKRDAQRLGQNDERRRLPISERECGRRLMLLLGNRLQSATHGFGHIGGDYEAKPDDGTRQAIDPDARRNNQRQQQRRKVSIRRRPQAEQSPPEQSRLFFVELDKFD